MGELIAVLSGKGGTGKTSVCAGIATALAEAGTKVLCIDCDVGLRNLDISLGLSREDSLSFEDVCSGSYKLRQAATHPLYPTLQFLAAPVSITADQVDHRAFAAMLRKAREQFNYVFLDAPAGVDAGFQLAARYADRVLLVTGADPASVRDARRTGEVLEQMGKSDVRLIVNRINLPLMERLGVNVDDIMDQAGLPLIGIVPDDPKVVLAAAFEKPLLKHAKRSRASLACRRIAKRVQGLSIPIQL